MRSTLDKGVLSHVLTAFPTPWSSEFTESDVDSALTCTRAPWTETTSGLAFYLCHSSTPAFWFGNCQGDFSAVLPLGTPSVTLPFLFQILVAWCSASSLSQ